MVSNGQHVKAAAGRAPRIWDGRYRIERTLGEGGMGQVSLARDLLLGERLVALKVLLPAFRSMTSGFMREYAVQRRLDHPVIPRVYDFGFGQHGGAEVPYFVMDYVRGMPLEDALLRKPDDDMKNGWLIQAIRGLDHLHRAGFLHRDMKPSNMLVHMEPLQGAGPNDHVDTTAHLIDFGISISLDETPEDYFIGTPEYSAPELMSGASFDVRQDLYAIGLLIYELVAGTRPWHGDDAVDLYRRRMTGEYPPLPKSCSPRLASLVGDLLHRKPSQRPSTAAEVLERFVDATTNHSADPTLGALRDTPIETPATFRRYLQKVPFVESEAFQAATTSWLDQPSMLLLEDPSGFDGVQLMHQLTDAVAVRGARVIRYALESRPHAPLEAIEPALAIVRRLREDGASFTGIAGAATLLSRLSTPLVIAIEGLGWADSLSLDLLATVFSPGARNPGLSFIATFDPRHGAVAASAFERLSELAAVRVIERPRLSFDVARAWIAAAVGVDVMPAERAQALWTKSEGKPQRLRELLAEELRQGALERKHKGYTWDASRLQDDRRAHMSQPMLLAVSDHQTLPDLISILSEPVPEGVVSTFLGVPSQAVRGYLADGLLARDRQGGILVGPRAASTNIPTDIERLLHERLARAIELAPSFEGKAERAARAWLCSPDPLRAVLHLVHAAERANVPRRGDALPCAALLLGEAREILDVEQGAIGAAAGSSGFDSEHAIARLEGLRIDVGVAQLGLARALGDWPTWRRVALDLAARSAAAGRVQVLEQAHAALFHLAADRGSEADMLAHAHALVAVSPDGVQALAWANARIERGEGRPEAALARIRGALALPSSPTWHFHLLALEAETLVLLGWIAEGTASVVRYATLARELGDRRGQAHASLLSAMLLREAQAPDKALAELRRLGVELGDDRCYRLDGRHAIELARAHVAFGWFETARMHLEQGIALAWRDGDREAAFAGRLVDARIVAMLGAHDEALEIIEIAREEATGLERTALRELEYTELEVAFAGGGIDLERLVQAARRLAAAAEREGMRSLALRALTLASRLATACGAGDDGVALALNANERADIWGAVGVPRHHILFALARARNVRRDCFRAQRTLGRAKLELDSAVLSLTDPQQRDALRHEPTNKLIDQGDLVTPERATGELRSA